MRDCRRSGGSGVPSENRVSSAGPDGMLFRFVAAVVIVTAVALGEIAIEKEILSLKRSISLQHYQLRLLEEKRARLILKTQEMAAPARLLEMQDRSARTTGEGTPEEQALNPLLEWRLRPR